MGKKAKARVTIMNHFIGVPFSQEQIGTACVTFSLTMFVNCKALNIVILCEGHR